MVNDIWATIWAMIWETMWTIYYSRHYITISLPLAILILHNAHVIPRYSYNNDTVYCVALLYGIADFGSSTAVFLKLFGLQYPLFITAESKYPL